MGRHDGSIKSTCYATSPRSHRTPSARRTVPSPTQPTALLTSAVNEHVVAVSGTFFGALLNDVVIAIRNVNVALTFGVNVLSYGLLRK